uniref:Uncharacterized protein n=1 Tax=Mucochytrium quahogii TaxID=96639 RepID=A0A7S2W8A0_9STRA|mmetsp:Transcript_17587/g.28466  ORF Transcript_17587/g.28466 Transcript_17587/m.28466 type:complete len:498 (+) Transcript_17587:254-1747(+)
MHRSVGSKPRAGKRIVTPPGAVGLVAAGGVLVDGHGAAGSSDGKLGNGHKIRQPIAGAKEHDSDIESESEDGTADTGMEEELNCLNHFGIRKERMYALLRYLIGLANPQNDREVDFDISSGVGTGDSKLYRLQEVKTHIADDGTDIVELTFYKFDPTKKRKRDDSGDILAICYEDFIERCNMAAEFVKGGSFSSRTDRKRVGMHTLKPTTKTRSRKFDTAQFWKQLSDKFKPKHKGECLADRIARFSSTKPMLTQTNTLEEAFKSYRRRLEKNQRSADDTSLPRNFRTILKHERLMLAKAIQEYLADKGKVIEAFHDDQSLEQLKNLFKEAAPVLLRFVATISTSGRDYRNKKLTGARKIGVGALLLVCLMNNSSQQLIPTWPRLAAWIPVIQRLWWGKTGNLEQDHHQQQRQHQLEQQQQQQQQQQQLQQPIQHHHMHHQMQHQQMHQHQQMQHQQMHQHQQMQQRHIHEQMQQHHIQQQQQFHMQTSMHPANQSL